MATFELAVYGAAGHLNIDNLASLLVYDNVNIKRGYYTIQGCIVDNNVRIKNAQRQNSDSAKTHRRYQRGRKKSKIDNTKASEGKVYSAGDF